MKKFTFTLERARQWRENQVALEEAHLERLLAGKALVEQRRELLEQEARESASVVLRANAVNANELQAVDTFRRYVVAQRAAIAAALAECGRDIAGQRGKVMAARRNFELLARLKEKRWNAWTTALARELETEAGEMFLAKWKP